MYFSLDVRKYVYWYYLEIRSSANRLSVLTPLWILANHTKNCL